MTFVVNQNGMILLKALGAKVIEIAAKFTGFDPGDGWQPTEPETDSWPARSKDGAVSPGDWGSAA